MDETNTTQSKQPTLPGIPEPIATATTPPQSGTTTSTAPTTTTAPSSEMPEWARKMNEKLEAILGKEAATKQAEAEKASEKQKAEAAAKEKEAAIASGTVPELLEQKDAELAKARGELVETKIQSAIERAALYAGMKDPDFLRLIDRSGVKLTESGSVDGVEAAVAALKQKHPEFFSDSQSTPRAPMAGGAPRNAPQQPLQLTEEQKRFAKTFGWESKGMRYQKNPFSPVVTFEQNILGKEWMDAKKVE